MSVFVFAVRRRRFDFDAAGSAVFEMDDICKHVSVQAESMIILGGVIGRAGNVSCLVVLREVASLATVRVLLAVITDRAFPTPTRHLG
jgi:hypothetical protein